jgi:hypothetical protein
LAQIQNHVLVAEHFAHWRPLHFSCQEIVDRSHGFTRSLCLNLLHDLEVSEKATNIEQEQHLAPSLRGILERDEDLFLVIVIDDLQLLSEDEIKSLLKQLRVVSETRQDHRSLARILFVLGGHSLDLRQLDPERSSPFNIAERVMLDDLAQEDAMRLIESLLGGSGRRYSQLAAQHICHLTGNQPYLLRQTCSHLVENTVPAAGRSSEISFEVIENVVQAMCRDGRDPLLRQIESAVESLSSHGLECLRSILNGARYAARQETPFLQELALVGLVTRSRESIWAPRNPIYDRYLRQLDRVSPVIDSSCLMPRRLYVNIEGYRILYQLENDLRDFVFAEMFARFGDKWLDRIDEKAAGYCQGLKSNELESGWFPDEDLPELSYSLFSHLKKIISDNWTPVFHHYFKPKRIFEGYFEALESIRNRVAHNRPLTDYEIEQLDVIARQFRKCMDNVPGR